MTQKLFSKNFVLLKSAEHKTETPVKVSNATIIFLLFALSARMPPNGERRMFLYNGTV